MKGRLSRLLAAGRSLDADQRLAAGAALALLLTMFLPWYEKTAFVPGTTAPASDRISAFGAVSFVEAAIFLVSVGVLLLVLTRAEGGKFHLPGGDGTVILAAGLWASALIFYRVFDRPDFEGIAGSVGIQWGFFLAFIATGALALAGQRIRSVTRPQRPIRHRPRPPAPHDDFDGLGFEDDDADVPDASATEPPVPEAPRRSPRRRMVGREDAEKVTFDDSQIGDPPAPSRGTRRDSSED
ncbi:MAG: hypothetical protein ACR2LK_06035 [Solirubrobacteraceae bacterium]